MGAKIDRIVFFALAGVAGYAYFYWATRRAWMALLLTALLYALLLIAYRPWRGWREARAQKAQAAQKTLDKWLYMQNDAALQAARRCVLRAFPEETGADIRFELIQQHPQGRPCDATRVVDLWKRAARAGAQALVLVNTAQFDERAQAVSEALSAPRVRLIDGRQLKGLLIAQNVPAPSEPPKPAKAPRFPTARAWLRALVNRRRAPRCALYGALLLALYLLLGIWAYLPCALFLIALAALGFRRPRAPTKLFN